MNVLIEGRALIVAMAVGLTVGLIVLALLYHSLRRKAVRVEAKRQVDAARLRSGYVPLDAMIPTTRGRLHSSELGPLPEWTTQDETATTVDETPRMQIRYIDVNGKKVENVLQVQRLDVEKQLIVGYTTPGDMHVILLHQVLIARNAETGQQFNLDTWLEAVRIARRRRA